MDARCDIAVIGGGFYGCMIANHVRQYVDRVVLIEKHDDLMQRASLVNQARVHNGYHYPRSLLTALRARASFPRFVETFRDSIDNSFDKYYAIARRFSKVTASYFKNLCYRIGAPIDEAPASICRLFDADMIEAVFRVQEFAFDAVKLKHAMWQQLRHNRVDVRLNTIVERVADAGDGLTLTCQGPSGQQVLTAGRVFNCTYSQINALLAASGLPLLPLKHERAEMALVRVPEPLSRMGVTVMCGPFFSCMPYPSRGLHTLSHVRYTPHESWRDDPAGPCDAHSVLARERCASNFPSMQRDVARYLPLMRECQHVDSLWEVKTVLSASERDDSRPILFTESQQLPRLASIMAAKIDNVFDALDEMDARYFRLCEAA